MREVWKCWIFRGGVPTRGFFIDLTCFDLMNILRWLDELILYFDSLLLIGEEIISLCWFVERIYLSTLSECQVHLQSFDTDLVGVFWLPSGYWWSVGPHPNEGIQPISNQMTDCFKLLNLKKMMSPIRVHKTSCTTSLTFLWDYQA